MPATSQESAARRYRIEKYLTEGGMGAIYIGKKLGPGGFAKEVVLKQLLPEYTSRPEFRDLFFREAKISATLDHANIVHTFDLVESDQSLFIVMEYVRGADLRTIIRRARHRRRELSPAAAIYIALEILAGLGYAHARRDASGKSLDIIHRDVSPSNIICSVQGAAKLSDFGIAKASTHSSVFYRVRGKVGYMSPEQARSQQIDHRCDLFSLSVCLYESLSGERLFVGDLNTPADEIYGIKILPVSRKRPGLPAALDDVLLRALAANVDDRYQSAAELAEALRTVAHRAGLRFSAPELAAHLRDILGDSPERWLRDEPPAVINEPKPRPVGGSELVGTEAASIGIVSDIPEDEPGQSVLSPRAVSGSKDFDLDSMLNDEATRPGGEERRGAAGAAAGSASAEPRPGAARNGLQNQPSKPSDPQRQAGQQEGPQAGKEAGKEASKTAGKEASKTAGKDDGQVDSAGTPPPVWTRDSGPFSMATPKVHGAAALEVGGGAGRKAASDAASEVGATAAGPGRGPAKLPGVRPAPSAVTAAAPVSRPLPRATIRSPAVPPPFVPTARVAPPPPAPPFPRATGGGRAGDDFEEPTPRPRTTAGAGATQPQPSSFDIEDALTPPPPARPVLGPGGGLRGSPPASYPAPQPAFDAGRGVHPSGPQPLVLSQPPTISFQDAVTALLPEKKGGPPTWFGLLMIFASMAGGAVLAHRVTRPQVAAALAVPERRAAIPSDDERPAAPVLRAVPVPAPPAEASPAPATDTSTDTKPKTKLPAPETPDEAPAAAPPATTKAAAPPAAAPRSTKPAKATAKNRGPAKPAAKRPAKH